MIMYLHLIQVHYEYFQLFKLERKKDEYRDD